MATYKLKPLVWHEGTYFDLAEHSTTSPTHDYTIRYDTWESSYVVIYHEFATDDTGVKHVSSFEEGKEWVENIHMPAKLKQWFDVIED